MIFSKKSYGGYVYVLSTKLLIKIMYIPKSKVTKRGFCSSINVICCFVHILFLEKRFLRNIVSQVEKKTNGHTVCIENPLKFDLWCSFSLQCFCLCIHLYRSVMYNEIFNGKIKMLFYLNDFYFVKLNLS